MDYIKRLIFETTITSNDVILDQPNTDMIIRRPYLFYYIPINTIDQVKNNGIKSSKGIDSFFIRIPNLPQYRDYLKDHVPVKISVSKLVKSSKKIKVVGINFPGKSDIEVPLNEEKLTKLVNYSDKFYKCFEKCDSLDNVPIARIMFSDGILPAFTFKVLDNIKEGMNALNDKKIMVLVNKAMDDLSLVKNDNKSKIPQSVKTVLIKTDKINEFKKLIPMAKRLIKITKGVDRSEFIAAKAILNSLINKTDSKSELLKFIHNQ